MAGLKITGWGTALPERVVTNEELAKQVDTSDEWIRQRSGIHERRFIEPGQMPADLAREASERALDAAGLDSRGMTLHALRHTAATRLWLETSDLFWTQQLLGHANIRTTAMYVQSRPTEAMRDAMNAASL